MAETPRQRNVWACEWDMALIEVERNTRWYWSSLKARPTLQRRISVLGAEVGGMKTGRGFENVLNE